MLSLFRAEDGERFQVDASVRDIERVGRLELFLSQHTHVPEDAVLAYLSDGRRVTSGNIRELAGSPDQAIYVFNKQFLDVEIDEALAELRVEPGLQPPVEESIPSTPPFRPSLVAPNYLRAAHAHLSFISHTLSTIETQNKAILIALDSFDKNLLSLSATFTPIGEFATQELHRQAALLQGLNGDLLIISRVRVHSSFVSNSVRRAIEAGEKPRYLGDYVNAAKMRQVGETCRRTHEDLHARYLEVRESVLGLGQGSDDVRNDIKETSSVVDDSISIQSRAQEAFDVIAERAEQFEGPGADDSDAVLQELRQRDASLRDFSIQISNLKNIYTSHILTILRNISLLNTTLAQVPDTLVSLQTTLRNTSRGTGGGGAAGFGHIQRLHRMLYAYGATMIEVVRRKEFARFFYARAQSVLEIIAKLSVAERKRRVTFRSEVHGQLPFEVKGLGMGGGTGQEEDPVPTADLVFSPSPSSAKWDDEGSTIDGGRQTQIGREDVDGLLLTLDELETDARALEQRDEGAGDEAAVAQGMFAAVSECRGALEKLIVRMDGMEEAWERGVEKGLLTTSRNSIYRQSRRSTSMDDYNVYELAEHVRAAEEKEATWSEERKALEAEITRLQNIASEADMEKSRADRLERDLHHQRQQQDGESNARRATEDRHHALKADFELQTRELSRALADATAQAQIAEKLRGELADARLQFSELQKLEDANSRRVQSLLEEQRDMLRNLDEAHGRGVDLEAQIKAARNESEEVMTANEVLRAAGKEKEKLLREQEMAARDLRAEADGDRAVLEREFFEVKATLEEAERVGRDAKAEAEIANIDAKGLREELKRVEEELRDVRVAERMLRDDVRSGRASQERFEYQLENRSRLVAQILDVALAFRASHVRALSAVQSMTVHPSRMNSTNLADSTVSSPFSPPSLRHNIIGQPEEAEPSPIDVDPANPESALEALRAFDHDVFAEAIVKTGSTIRKWQKQCKEYRERAKGKISFRNFTKGDLALFLPTRNSVSKPWAAFNVSFPHYFLQATGHLADQLKTREWIVARITSITERVVDSNDPNSNPYGLGDGVKYYMLQVEDWTQPTPQSKRRLSSKKQTNDSSDQKEQVSSLESEALPPPPGPPSADSEETFRVAHPPNSHFFPIRANSSPSARPSSLSRLLAQASENQLETTAEAEASPTSIIIPEELKRPRTPPSPTTAVSPPPPISPLQAPPSSANSTNQHAPVVSSPLRPGSRSSRLSSGSRFSAGRIPPIGGSVSSGSQGVTGKASATTAVTDRPLLASPTSSDANPFVSPETPSPEGSVTDGMASILMTRRRTASYHVPRDSSMASTSSATGSSSTAIADAPTRPNATASSTLANIVSGSWGFGRRRRPDGGPSSFNSPETVGSKGKTSNKNTSKDESTDAQPQAKDILRRF